MLTASAYPCSAIRHAVKADCRSPAGARPRREAAVEEPSSERRRQLQTTDSKLGRCRAPAQPGRVMGECEALFRPSGRPAFRLVGGEVLQCAVQQPVHAELAGRAALFLAKSPTLFQPPSRAKCVITANFGWRSPGCRTLRKTQLPHTRGCSSRPRSESGRLALLCCALALSFPARSLSFRAALGTTTTVNTWDNEFTCCWARNHQGHSMHSCAAAQPVNGIPPMTAPGQLPARRVGLTRLTCCYNRQAGPKRQVGCRSAAPRCAPCPPWRSRHKPSILALSCSHHRPSI